LSHDQRGQAEQGREQGAHEVRMRRPLDSAKPIGPLDPM
jgi:hypothetical protein